MHVNSRNRKLEHVSSAHALSGHRKWTPEPFSEKRHSLGPENFDLAFSISRFNSSYTHTGKYPYDSQNSDHVKKEAFSKSADSGKIRELQDLLPDLRPSLSSPKLHVDGDCFINTSIDPVLSGLHNVTTTTDDSSVCASKWEFPAQTSSKSALVNQTHAGKINNVSMKSTDLRSVPNTQRFSTSLDGLSLKHMARSFSNTSGVTLTSYSSLANIENQTKMKSLSFKNAKKKLQPVKSEKKTQWSPIVSRFFKSSERNKKKQPSEVSGINLEDGTKAPAQISEDFDDSFPFTYDYASIDEEESSDEESVTKDNKLNLSWPISRFVGLRTQFADDSCSEQIRKQEEVNRLKQDSDTSVQSNASERMTEHLEKDTTIDEIAAFSVKFELMPNKRKIASEALEVPKKEYSRQPSWMLSKSWDSDSRRGSVTSEESINAIINKYRNRNTPDYSSSPQSGV